MAETYAPSFIESDDSPLQPGAPLRPDANNISSLEHYRISKKNLIYRKMAKAATKLYSEKTVSVAPTPIDTYEHENGDLTAKFNIYDTGFPSSDMGVTHRNGWSGGPETIRVVASHYSKELDLIESSEVHPRNLRYIQSDIRAKQRTDEYEREIQAIYRAIDT